MRDAGERSRSWRTNGLRAAVALAIVLIVGLLIHALVGRDRPGERGAEASSCNGVASLCERRLGEVVFPATHNSFAASDEPAWHFAGQRYGISRQLEDGIRALLIDVHFGVYDPATGRAHVRAGSGRPQVEHGFARCEDIPLVVGVETAESLTETERGGQVNAAGGKLEPETPMPRELILHKRRRADAGSNMLGL
jgi:hypothetical protein